MKQFRIRYRFVYGDRVGNYGIYNRGASLDKLFIARSNKDAKNKAPKIVKRLLSKEGAQHGAVDIVWYLESGKMVIAKRFQSSGYLLAGDREQIVLNTIK